MLLRPAEPAPFIMIMMDGFFDCKRRGYPGHSMVTRMVEYHAARFSMAWSPTTLREKRLEIGGEVAHPSIPSPEGFSSLNERRVSDLKIRPSFLSLGSLGLSNPKTFLSTQRCSWIST